MPDWGIWILVALAFGAIEMATVGFFALLFAFGALATAVLALVTANWPLQATFFIASSIVFMWVLRPSLVKLYGKEHVRTGAERAIGRVGVVVQDIDNTESQGQIKADGEVWTARSASGENLDKGQKVEIVRIEGVRAIVKKREE